jgi:hypothetical protein
MAVTLNGSRANLVGLSTDSKPTDVEVNTIFLELNTGNFYYFDGTNWLPIGG